MKIPVRKFLKNTGWNLLGQIAPLVVAVAVLPWLIKAMGLERYGFLTLVWAIVGYAGLFDFGIGRAITRCVAFRLGNGDEAGARHVANVGMTYMLLFGALVGLVLAAASPWLATGTFKIPPAMSSEVLHSFLLLSVTIPFAMLSAGYNSILIAHERFSAMNIVRSLLGVTTYVGPLVIALLENRLEYVVGFIAVMRFVSNRLYARTCANQCGVSFVPRMPDRATSKELFSLGGWITVSNVISPFLTFLDRLVLGSLVDIKYVAYYSTPYDMISKSLMVPYALMGAIFPAAAGQTGNAKSSSALFALSLRSLFIFMLPFDLAIFVLARPLLTIWLGDTFAAQATPVLQCLVVGFLLIAMTQVPATMIQAAGHPKWMAVSHVAELPVFIGLLWFLTKEYGIFGTALASTLRMAIDACILFTLALRNIVALRVSWRVAAHVLFGTSLFVVAALLPEDWRVQVLYLIVALSLFAPYAWFFILDADERSRLGRSMRDLRFGGAAA